ncbi:hypothetical protein EAF00_007547 [Botryotinia globosa]|nr:hypothetical protein EAF00_007547 [Botryotinia globosa]
MMGEESKDKNLTESKPTKKKRERKHRQGFYNRDRRMHGVQRTFGSWEPAGREGAEQDAASMQSILNMTFMLVNNPNNALDSESILRA